MRMRSFAGWAAWGAVTYLAAQGALFLTLGAGDGADSAGWFLNSGRGVGTVAAIVVLATAAVFGFRAAPCGVSVGAFTIGAAAAIAGTLFVIGPGTIFPIVIAAGGAIVAVAATAGRLIGHGLRLARWRLSR
jgi:hypothetical protein